MRDFHFLLLLATPSVTTSSSFLATASCSGSSYFDPASLACRPCGAGQAPVNGTVGPYGTATGCACPASALTVPRSYNGLLTADTCTSCPPGLSQSADGLSCTPCGAGAVWSAATGSCACMDAGSALLQNATGAWVCTACPPRTYAFQTATDVFPAAPGTCAACADPRASVSPLKGCVCDTGFTEVVHRLAGSRRALVCLRPGALDAIKKAIDDVKPVPQTSSCDNIVCNVAFPSAPGGSASVNSLLFQSLYLPAAAGCVGWAPGDAGAAAACQALANLCALALFSPQHPACALTTALSSVREASYPLQSWGSGWPTSLPMLLWGKSTAALNSDPSLPTPMAFTGASSALRFHLARWALNGTFLGLAPLRNQLAYCGGEGGALPSPRWLSFGHSSTATLPCDIAALLTGGGAVTYSAASSGSAGLSLSVVEPVLYDLFVEDLSAAAEAAAAGSSGGGGGAAPAALDAARAAALLEGTVSPSRLPLNLVPVPVRITNYVDASGGTPNSNTAFAQEGNDVYTGRFALWDGASGVAALGAPPVVVRFATAARLTLSTINGDSGDSSSSLRLPVLTLTYREASGPAVLAAATGGASDTLTLTVEYTRSAYLSYSNALTGCGLALAALVVVWAAALSLSWLRMNARTPLEGALGLRAAARFVLHLASVFAASFYWLLVVFTLYWLVFFKLQVSCCGGARAERTTPLTSVPFTLPPPAALRLLPAPPQPPRHVGQRVHHAARLPVGHHRVLRAAAGRRLIQAGHRGRLLPGLGAPPRAPPAGRGAGQAACGGGGGGGGRGRTAPPRRPLRVRLAHHLCGARVGGACHAPPVRAGRDHGGAGGAAGGGRA